METTIKIDTAVGKKTIIGRVGAQGEYYFEAPNRSAPNGAWWILNEQKGFVPIPSNGRALLHAIEHHGWAVAS